MADLSFFLDELPTHEATYTCASYYEVYFY
jgi:hypothetical protein